MAQSCQLPAALQEVFRVRAERIAWETGCCRRASALSGAGLVQALVFGFLAEPEATLEDLAQAAGAVGRPVTTQAMHQRFTPAAVECLQRVLAAMMRVAVDSEPTAGGVLSRFTAVHVQDSTTVALPVELIDEFPGGRSVGGAHASLKAQVRFELIHQRVRVMAIAPGRSDDHTTPTQTQAIQPGELHLRDLGYFHLDVMRQIAQKQAFFLSRLQSGTTVFNGHARPIDLATRWGRGKRQRWDINVSVGNKDRLPVRLVAVRVPPAVARQRRKAIRHKGRKKGYQPSRHALRLCAWSVYITNVPKSKATVDDVLALARARWQIECLFKHWKTDGRLDQSRSRKPYRIAGEVFAKLIALLVKHWLVITQCPPAMDRSIRKAAKAVRKLAITIAAALPRLPQLRRAIHHLANCLAYRPRVESRRKQPSTFQILQTSPPPKSKLKFT